MQQKYVADLHTSITELKEELVVLTAKRLLRPSREYGKRMEVVMMQLYKLTNDNQYKL